MPTTTDSDQPKIPFNHIDDQLLHSTMLVASRKDGNGFDQIWWVQDIGCRVADVPNCHVVWMLMPFKEHTGMYGFFASGVSGGLSYQVDIHVDDEGNVVWPEDCPYEFREINPVEWQHIQAMWPGRIWGECPTAPEHTNL